ncbi:hypothetical protein BC829DRAFT_381511 [Chytridium lagenaria]|nr:hypothetical protein BC829DRAFT_381511 [Chytridium lagenaria]
MAPTGIHKQARFRLPLFVNIMAVVVTLTALIGIVVGYLTLSRAQESINEITLTLRTSILNRARESVTTTLDNTLRVLKMKSKNTLLSQYISSWNDTATWLSTPTVLSYHYTFAAETEALENTGLLFRADSNGNQSYMAAYRNGVRFTTKTRKLRTQPRLQHSVIRNDWMPNTRFPQLQTDGIERGKPFWSAPVYTPVVKTFLIPLLWPVWSGRSLGNTGDGGYTAAHFAMLSIKSLDDFLRTVEVSKNGAISIIEGSTGLMLASSIAGVAQNGTANSRFSAVSNPNALISAAATFVANQYGSNGTIQSIPSTSAQTFATSFKALDDDILVNGHWIRDASSGMNWLVLLTIPSNDFLSVIRSTFRNAVISVAGFVKLAKSMVQATQFDFSELRDGYLERRSCVTEIGRLEGVFHELMLKFANAIKANKALITARGDNVAGLSTTSGGLSQTASAVDMSRSGTTFTQNSSGKPSKPYAPWE